MPNQPSVASSAAVAPAATTAKYQRDQDHRLIPMGPGDALLPPPPDPKTPGQSYAFGREAASLALGGADVYRATHRKGFGWVDFLQGVGDGDATPEQGPYGVRHVVAKHTREGTGDSDLPGASEMLDWTVSVIVRGMIVSGSKHSALVSIVKDGWKAVIGANKPEKGKAKPGGFLLVTGFRMGPSGGTAR